MSLSWLGSLGMPESPTKRAGVGERGEIGLGISPSTVQTGSTK